MLFKTPNHPKLEMKPRPLTQHKQPTNVSFRRPSDQASQSNQQPANFGVNANDIKLDLTAGKGRPEWIFSSYSPARDVPRQLFGGPQREQSMEEMRLRHYEAVAAGNMNQAVQEAEALWGESVKQMDAALNDLNGAVNYIVGGANEHPNRLDIVEGKTGPDTNQGSQGSAFGQPAAPAQPTNAFGQPSQPSAFGQPAFGSGSAFGQPSSLGGQSGFGKPAFGQSGFSQSGNSAPAFGQTAFGQPSAPAAAAPFGAPSAASPFTQVGQNQSAGGFGQPSGQQSQAAAPFGQPSQPQASPFSQTSAAAPAAPFGQPSQPNPSPFGQQQQPQQPSPFGLAAPSANTNPFGAAGAASNQPNASPFGQAAAPQGVPVTQTNTGPRPSIKIDDPSMLNPFPQLQGETRRDPTTKALTMWKGRPVRQVKIEDGTLRPAYVHPQDNKTLVRIMFPDGSPDDASLKDALSTPEQFTPEIEQMYKFFFENGYFKDGVIPTIPPKKDAVSFDF
ncbi:hypothetical protein N7450_009889 [Penicillium hetheringtonii]|uniref:CCCH zinc finger domain protein n=1 Tax=Penicillium hetheringtonii TaxID=911720 RepID=A0AAD6DBR5_9EURO|nr:hypothetical protein N7450_009889 [Penicillium hetheringtonii]